MRKVMLNCPTCRSRLNPSKRIGRVGICDRCGWAGSHHSQNYSDWIQFKVSMTMVIFALIGSYAIFGGQDLQDRIDRFTGAEYEETIEEAQQPRSRSQRVQRQTRGQRGQKYARTRAQKRSRSGRNN